MDLAAAEPLVVGRGAELAVLDRAAQAARAGRMGVVLVEGRAGVGKTALLRRWLAGDSLSGSFVLRAACDRAESDVAYGVVEQLTRKAPPAMLHRHTLLRGAPSPRASVVQVGGQMLRLLDDLQGQSPVLMVVEDVHWADERSLQAIGFVLRRLEADRVLTVLTARPPAPDELRRPAIERDGVLALAGLEESAVADLARTATGRELDSAVVRRLWRHTDGSPLYLRTILSEVPTDRLHSDPDRSLPVPTSLASGIRMQLAGLMPDARAVVEAAAVLGGRRPLPMVGQLAEVSEPSAVLAPALKADLLRWWPAEPFCPVEVTHALQQDAVLEAMDPLRRRALHTRAAGLVASGASWRHKVAAADGPDPALAQDLERAARTCLDSGDVDRAATLLLWSADLVPTREERERLLLTAAAHLAIHTRVGRVTPLIDAVRACARNPLRALVTGLYAMSTGRLDMAGPDLAEAFDGSRGDPSLHWIAGVAGGGLGYTHYFSGAPGEDTVRVSRQVLLLDDLDASLTLWAKCTLVLGRMSADGPQAGLRELQAVSPLPPARHVTPDQAWTLILRGCTHVLCGLPARGREDLVRSLEVSETGAGQGLEETALLYLAIACHWTGAWDDAAIHAAAALTTATTEHRLYAYGGIYAVSAWVPAGRGDADRARYFLDAAEQHILPYQAGLLHVGRALEAQARADWPAMLEAVNRSPRDPAIHNAEHRVLWKPLHAEALIRTGRLVEAAAEVDGLRAMTAAHPALSVAAAWLSGQLAEARGAIGAARASYETGLAVSAGENDNSLHRAFLEHAYGRHLTATGHAQRARTWLKRARRRYGAMNATAYLRRCDADLADLGTTVAQPGGVAAPDSLNIREREIAHLVSKGLTNKEIAGQLFISSKTVEYHLGNVYARLGLDGRRQLRDLIQQYARMP
jgi:DNA-binding CsgD family transcriptional regulator